MPPRKAFQVKTALDPWGRAPFRPASRYPIVSLRIWLGVMP